VSNAFVVEKFIEGDVHRVTLVNGHVVASCLREPPNVVGNGIHTIKELIEIKNKNPLRGEPRQKNFTLHKIHASARTHSLLSSQNLTLESIPPRDKKVYLNDKVILACGADVHDTTDLIHPENNLLFKKVYALCNAPLIGIDFITKDIEVISKH
jgi:cyanophycin synthetase